MIPRRCPEVEELRRGVVAFELWGDGDPSWLAEPELALVDHAVEARITQFAAGRHCARLALAELDVEPAPVLRSTGRAPAWPAGVYGSISHTDGYAVAVVGRPDETISSVGIDAERVGRLGAKLYDRLFVAEERQWLAQLDEESRSIAATELFGLKESYYKAQFPLTEAWVGFHDVGIEHRGEHWVLDRASNLVALRAVTWPCQGRSLIRDGIAVTVVGAVAAG